MMNASGFGLFDPALEKDSCGVGFIADIKGRKSHKIVDDALTILVNLEHRGAVGADPRAGDGAGISGADAAQIPRQEGGRAWHHAAAARRLRGRRAVLAARRGMAAAMSWTLTRRLPREEGMTMLGWRDVPTDNSTLGETGQADRAGATSRCFSPAAPKITIGGRVRAPALHPAQDDLRHALRQARSQHVALLSGVDLVPHPDLQGHVPRRPARRLLPRPARSGFRKRAGAGAPALLHQHVPGLVAGAPLPHDRA